MNATQSYEVNGSPILVFDDLIEPTDIRSLHSALMLGSFTFLHSSTQETRIYREWAAEISMEDFVKTVLGRVSKKVASIYTKLDCACTGVFASASTFGDNAFVHEDSSSLISRVSVLYYANPVWELEWAGETLFFSNDEARIAISPRPGRILAFSGSLRHRAGVPSRHCPEVRLVVSSRFKSQ